MSACSFSRAVAIARPRGVHRVKGEVTVPCFTSMRSLPIQRSFLFLAGVLCFLFTAILATAQDGSNLDLWSSAEQANNIHLMRRDAVAAASSMSDQERSSFLTKLADLAKDGKNTPAVRFNAALAIGEISDSGDKPCAAAAPIMQGLLAEDAKQPDFILLASLLGMVRQASGEGISDANKAIVVDSLTNILDPALAKKRNIQPQIANRLQALAVRGLAALKSVSGYGDGTRVLDTFVRIAKDPASDLALLDEALLGIAGIDLKAAADSGVDVTPLVEVIDTAYSTIITKEISMIEMQTIQGQVSSNPGMRTMGGMGGPGGPGGMNPMNNMGGMGGMNAGMGMNGAGSQKELEMTVAQITYDVDCVKRAVQSLSDALGEDDALASSLKKLGDRAEKTTNFIAYGDLALDDDFDPTAKENRLRPAGKNDEIVLPVTIVGLKAFLENQKWEIKASAQRAGSK